MYFKNMTMVVFQQGDKKAVLITQNDFSHIENPEIVKEVSDMSRESLNITRKLLEYLGFHVVLAMKDKFYESSDDIGNLQAPYIWLKD